MSIGETLSNYMNGRHVKEHRRKEIMKTAGIVGLIIVCILAGYAVASL